MRRLGRVLVVDDDPAVRAFVRDALRAEGYAVETAPDAGEALDGLWAGVGRPAGRAPARRAPAGGGRADLRRAVPARSRCATRRSSSWLPARRRPAVATQIAARAVLRKPFELNELLQRLRRALQPPAP